MTGTCVFITMFDYRYYCHLRCLYICVRSVLQIAVTLLDISVALSAAGYLQINLSYLYFFVRFGSAIMPFIQIHKSYCITIYTCTLPGSLLPPGLYLLVLNFAAWWTYRKVVTSASEVKVAQQQLYSNTKNYQEFYPAKNFVEKWSRGGNMHWFHLLLLWFVQEMKCAAIDFTAGIETQLAKAPF